MRKPSFSSSESDWILSDHCSAITQQLARLLPLHPIVAQILISRSMTDLASCRSYLTPLDQPLFDPMLLRDMGAAIQRIEHAIARGEQILAYGDYDVDGTCSAVILKTSLELLGASVELHIPHRLQEGYGLRHAIIEQAARRGIRLLITADTGIRDHHAVEYAGSLGIDVIITDHHAPDTTLPRAVAVVNPNRADCAYPNKHLCGAGVAYKLIEALFRRSSFSAARQQQLLGSLLKPLAIATIADVVPLVGENRTIVARGLRELQQLRTPGLTALFSVAGLVPGRTPCAQEIAFRVAPRINAAGRMESASLVTDLLLTRDKGHARILALQLDRCNRDRREIEQMMCAELLTSLQEEQEDAQTFDHVFFSPTGHLGVVGIVASRLVERLGRPIVVLTHDPKESGVLAGSGRSIPGFHLLEALESMAGLFLSFGGHSQAAGLRMEAKRVEEFHSRFRRCASEHLGNASWTPARTADAEVRFSDLTAELAQELEKLEPFGCGNLAPVLLARRVQIAGPVRTLTPGKHFVVPLMQDGCRITCKAWGFAHHMPLIQSGALLDVLFTIENDSYSARRGGASWCIVLRDVRPFRPKADSESLRSVT